MIHGRIAKYGLIPALLNRFECGENANNRGITATQLIETAPVTRSFNTNLVWKLLCPTQPFGDSEKIRRE
jgi:hypothetical protein